MEVMMDSAYVSEFTLFMNQFLEQHPEVVKDQQRGWNFSWRPEIDQIARPEQDQGLSAPALPHSCF
jgi:hypothetical protein